MDVRSGLASLPLEAEATAVTIGFFDGVHRGHRSVFQRTIEVAASAGATPVAVTFDRHPREVVGGEPPPLLTTLERRAELIAATGIEHIVVLEFSEELSRWPADRFVERVLVEGLRARRAVVGTNFRFGHGATGDVALLRRAGAMHGFGVDDVPLLAVGGRTVSSSAIRADIADGRLGWPTEALGRRYEVSGTVAAGAGRGTGLGYPTANLEVPPRILLPAEGVYAGTATVDGGTTHVAAINVGTNPTFGGEPLHAEAFLIDYTGGDLRGRRITLEFWTRLRDEERFDSAEALVEQIAADVARARELVR